MSGAHPVKICVNQIAATNGIQAIDWPGLIEVRRREAGPAPIFNESSYIKEPSGAESIFMDRFGNFTLHQYKRCSNAAFSTLD